MGLKVLIAMAAAIAATAGPSAAAKEAYHLIPGRVPLDWQGPDGNTIILDAPKGLIVIDTGRSPMHAQAILDYAKQVHRPIAAIVNSHWHLDHTTGNYDIRQVYPETRVYASNAIEGALVGFLGKGKAQAEKALADPKTPEGQKAQTRRGRDRIEHPDKLRPTDVVTKTGPMNIAGRMLDVHLAKFAATEGDVWLYDRKTRTAMAGDLVVGIVPFMDSACPDGWSKALDQVAATPFKTLIPGHGDVMSRAEFLQWRTAYSNYVACGRSKAEEKKCVDGWMRDAAKFIPEDHRNYVREAAAYYIEARLRSSPEEQQHFCKPLKSS